jgi:hypothetical protein
MGKYREPEIKEVPDHQRLAEALTREVEDLRVWADLAMRMAERVERDGINLPDREAFELVVELNNVEDLIRSTSAGLQAAERLARRVVRYMEDARENAD